MAFDFPDQFRFADSHEYVRQEAELVRVGLSAYAVDQLGDIVFVDLPELGSELSRGTSFGTVESVKAVEEMYAPITGEVVQRNEAVLANPEELQNDPHGEGWLSGHPPVRSSPDWGVDGFSDLLRQGGGCLTEA